jgi:excisionase family DNA binding protein
MTNRDINLTASFAEYLNTASNIEEISDNNIIMSIYGALNDLDSDEDIIRLIHKMIIDYEHIGKVLTAIAKDIGKNAKIESINQKKLLTDKWLTSKEAAELYPISEQAIRKACREGRLSFEKGTGKNKYLVKREDIAKYMQSAKGKGCKEAA